MKPAISKKPSINEGTNPTFTKADLTISKMKQRSVSHYSKKSTSNLDRESQLG